MSAPGGHGGPHPVGQLRTAARRRATSPFAAIARRLGIAVGLLVLTVATVLLDAGGYRDSAGGRVGVLDAVYYATVSLSTTGYGDIIPVTPAARLVNVLVITPARLLFLVVLVGTTLQVLTDRSREAIRAHLWRSKLEAHTVVCGYGTTGRAAVRTLLEHGTPRDQIVVADVSSAAVAEANDDGLTGVVGDVTRTAVLARTEVGSAEAVIVNVGRDDTAVLTVLTVRQLTTTARVVAASRSGENVPLLRQAGADVVLTTADSAGRLLGLSTSSPHVVEVVNDLITTGGGLDLVEHAVSEGDIGRPASTVPGLVISVVRDGRPLPPEQGRTATLRAGDRVVCVVDAPDPSPRDGPPGG